MKTVNQLRAEINKLQSQIDCIEKSIKDKYLPKFEEEVRNFLDKVGDGYVNGDYYARPRYYSDIYFIKNIRWGRKNIRSADNIIIGDVPAIEVKLLSPAGKLLPNEIEIDGDIYPIVFSYSKNYQGEIDY